MALAVPAVKGTLNLPPREDIYSSTRSIDFLGAISLFIAVATPLFAINIGGNIMAWNHPAEIALLCLTPFGFALFCLIETRIAAFPIIPTRFIRMPSVIAVITCAFPIVFAFNQVETLSSSIISSLAEQNSFYIVFLCIWRLAHWTRPPNLTTGH